MKNWEQPQLLLERNREMEYGIYAKLLLLVGPSSLSRRRQSESGRQFNGWCKTLMWISKQSYSNLDNLQIGATLAAVEATGFSCSAFRLGYQPVDYRNIHVPLVSLKNAFIVDAESAQ